MSDSMAFRGLLFSNFKKSLASMTREEFDGLNGPTTFEEMFGLDLAHLWSEFGEGTWIDAAGGFDANPQSNSPQADTQNGHSYPVFDGVDTGMESASVTALDGLSDWCIFGAFKTNNGSALGAIIDHDGQFYVELASGMVVDDDGAGGSSIIGDLDVFDNLWTRFIITVTGNEASLYINGVQDGTSTFSTLIASANSTLFGVQPNTTVTDSSILLIGIATRGITQIETGQLDTILTNWIG